MVYPVVNQSYILRGFSTSHLYPSRGKPPHLGADEITFHQHFFDVQRHDMRSCVYETIFPSLFFVQLSGPLLVTIEQG